MKPPFRRALALFGLILLATLLRFYRLSAQDIWGDEAFSIFLSQQPLHVVVAGGSDTHPPLYPLLLYFWLQLAGSSAFAARALSALIAIPVVPLIFVLAKRLTSRTRVAWFAAILAAVSPLLIYYSQETRMYELVAVLSLVSAYWTIRWLNAKPAVTLAIAFLVSTALALYTHYAGFFVLAAENFFACVRLFRRRSELVRWLGLQAILALAYVPWIIVQSGFLRGKASARFDEWGWHGIEMIFGKTFLAFSAGVTMETPAAQFSAALFLLFATIGVWTIWKTRETTACFALLYFSVPVMMAYIVNPIMPFFYERYVLVALPGFLLTVAFGLDALSRRNRRAAAGILMAFVAISTFSLAHYYFDDTYAKGKYGTMMAFVSQNAQPGDALILNNPLQKPLFKYYTPINVPAFFFPDGAPLEDPVTRKQVEAVAREHPRIWLVMFGNPEEYDPTGYLKKWFGMNAFKSYANGYVDAGLSLYAMPHAAPGNIKPQRAQFGAQIQLLGFALDREQFSPGDIVQLTLQWNTLASIEKSYTVFAHVIGAVNPATAATVWAQMDDAPVGGAVSTTEWKIGETITDRRGLLLPKDVPPGDYQIEVGLYDSATGARLPVQDELGNRFQDDRIILKTIRVEAR